MGKSICTVCTMDSGRCSVCELGDIIESNKRVYEHMDAIRLDQIMDLSKRLDALEDSGGASIASEALLKSVEASVNGEHDIVFAFGGQPPNRQGKFKCTGTDCPICRVLVGGK